MYKSILKKGLPHIIVVLIFFLISAVYFYPQFSGKALYQQDNDHFLGMSKEVMDHLDKEGENALWTNSMFGGMPAYQIYFKKSSNWILEIESALLRLIKSPVAHLFLCFIGFYIMLLCFNVGPWVSLIGSIAFGLSTINILYIGAGHLTRVHAFALMGPVIGSVIYTYRKHLVYGAILTALFVALQISANHLQETYYLLYILLAVVGFEFYRHIVEKKLKSFVKASGFLVAAAIIGVLPAWTMLSTTQEYSKVSTRSQSELTIHSSIKSSAERTSGLDPDYIKEYNFGKGELWSVVIPNVKGGSANRIGNKPDLLNGVPDQYKKDLANQSTYWGDQSFSGGAFYFGASMFLLMVLGMFFVRDKIKWPLLGVAFLAMILSLKYSGVVDFFIENVPMFNKFRDTKIMMIVPQIIFPLIGVLFVNELIKTQHNIKKMMYVMGGTLAVFLIILASPQTWFSFLSSEEATAIARQQEALQANPQQAENFNGFIGELESVRVSIFRADLWRTILFIVLTGALVLGYVKKIFKKEILFAGLAIIVLVDLWMVDQRYLNSKLKGQYGQVVWVDNYERNNPFVPTPADIQILKTELSENPELKDKISKETEEYFKNNKPEQKNKNHEGIKIAFRELNLATNYRVLTLNNPFNNGSIPYFHKSIGGYHGAKLKRYQELIDFKLSFEIGNIQSLYPGKTQTLNMLNTKYIVYPGEKSREENQVLPNPAANSPAWFVSEYKIAENADEEICGLINPDNMKGVKELYVQKNELERQKLELRKQNPSDPAIAVLDKKIEGLQQDIYNQNSFDSKKTSIISKDFENYVAGKSFVQDSSATIKMLSYKPNHLVYEANCSSEQLVVFSEIYYAKGWNAYINDQPVDHFRANYVLRAMVVPAGKSKIEFRFEPSSYKNGNLISMAGSIVLLLLVFGALGWEIKKNFFSKKS
ncbi:MAG: YfhO family protein [Bacteroidales bacterium]|nr:YfhO family protein [Bacteroidales bacterium]